MFWFEPRALQQLAASADCPRLDAVGHAAQLVILRLARVTRHRLGAQSWHSTITAAMTAGKSRRPGAAQVGP